MEGHFQIETWCLVMMFSLAFVFKTAKLWVLNVDVKASVPKYQDKGTITFQFKN